MKKTMILVICAALSVRMAAQETEVGTDSTYRVITMEENAKAVDYDRPEIVHQDGAYVGADMDANWFLEVQGGYSAFIGNPVGHGDLFDRTMPLLHVAVGKWISPTIGLRVAFEGFKLKDSGLQPRTYQNVHIDAMYNLMYMLRKDFTRRPRWSVSPLAGVGIIRNAGTGRKPFAITYGLNIGYRLSERLSVNAEIANSMTWRSFDGIGEDNKFGDNLTRASLGLNITIGKTGWKPVIDTEPLIVHNEKLNEKLAASKKENDVLRDQHRCDQSRIYEMHKILEIENLLEKYGLEEDNCGNYGKPARNNYSGLNSLRMRLRCRDMKKPAGNVTDEPYFWNPNDTTTMTGEEYAEKVISGEMYIGAPIFFFFNLGNTKLTEGNQGLNIKEIASAMRKFSLRARIIGAADAQTGTADINNRLGMERAEFIASQLTREGIARERITTEGRGGITDYVPQNANRNACVMLYIK